MTEKVRIKQATKQGFIECVVGGGCRSLLSKLENKAWSSTRGRNDLPDNYSTEYRHLPY